MITRSYYLLLALLLAATATGCHAGRTVEKVASPAQKVASSPENVASSLQKVASSPEKGGKLAPLARLTDAVGLSTPTGRTARQARRAAAATVPRRMGRGAVYAPLATQVAASYKSSAPVTVAAPGASVNNAGAGSQQQAVNGNGNELKAEKRDTTVKSRSVADTLKLAAVGVAAVFALYWFWPLLLGLFRRQS